MSDTYSPIEQEILSGRPVVITTAGVSMQPLLYHKSTRVVVLKADKELLPGDLPVYKRADGQLVIHRILRKDDDYYYIRGDNCISTEKVPKSDVIGVVTEIYRKNRHFTVDNRWYLIYVRLWNAIFPIRRLWMRFEFGVAARIKSKGKDLG